MHLVILGLKKHLIGDWGSRFTKPDDIKLDPELRNSGATSLCMWEAIQTAILHNFKTHQNVSLFTKLKEITISLMPIPTIYIDESGNTGSDLLNKQQPVFTTASCDFTDEEARYLLSKLPSSNADEVHFKRLRKTASGQNAIVELLSDELINLERVEVQLTHKEFMVPEFIQ